MSNVGAEGDHVYLRNRGHRLGLPRSINTLDDVLTGDDSDWWDKLGPTDLGNGSRWGELLGSNQNHVGSEEQSGEIPHHAGKKLLRVRVWESHVSVDPRQDGIGGGTTVALGGAWLIWGSRWCIAHRGCRRTGITLLVWRSWWRIACRVGHRTDSASLVWKSRWHVDRHGGLGGVALIVGPVAREENPR
jgi:hypothetical protein